MRKKLVSFCSKEKRNIRNNFMSAVAVVVAGAFCWVAWTAAAPPTTMSLPLAPHAQVVNVTPPSEVHGEPSIAVNPNNPKQLVAGYQRGAEVSYSTDGGVHWKTANIGKSLYRYSSDPVMVYDNKGHAFYGHLSFAGLPWRGYWQHDAPPNGAFVRRSMDGGKTWGPEIPLLNDTAKVNNVFEDKQWMAADVSKASPYLGYLYNGWTHDTTNGSDMYFSRSTNDGKSWSKPIQISSTPGRARGLGHVGGFVITLGRKGTIYTAWSNGSHIVFAKSSDGGLTFTPSHNIIKTDPGEGGPSISIDPRRNELYICWDDMRLGEDDVFVSTSSNGGTTWSAPVKVNNDPAHDYAPHILPWLSVDPTTGDAYVVFYDFRNDPYRHRETMVVLARSTDHGRTFTNYRWLKKPFDNHGNGLGDYTNLVAYGGRVWGIWAQVPPNAKKPTTPPKGLPPWWEYTRYVRVSIAYFGH